MTPNSTDLSFLLCMVSDLRALWQQVSTEDEEVAAYQQAAHDSQIKAFWEGGNDDGDDNLQMEDSM